MNAHTHGEPDEHAPGGARDDGARDGEDVHGQPRVARRVHELANAFSLKSQSKGKGDTRYTVLTKTTRSGTNVNERKVRRILGGPSYWDTTGSGTGRGGKGRGKVDSLAKHREGEEVGKVRCRVISLPLQWKLI